jgi:acetamidase/formamidase
MRTIAAIATLCLFPLATAIAQPASHQLKTTKDTVVCGHYDATRRPVLRIKSGDSVELHQTPEDLCRTVGDRGPGTHRLTGPIYIEGAEPGDVLEVRVKSVRLLTQTATNIFRPGGGALPAEFPYARRKDIPLDDKRMVAMFAPGIEIPLRPFFGSMGVAPPPQNGRISSNPPWIHAGNHDNKELVAGTSLYIPVHVPGALFQAGDGHAAQGNGEVTGTALETSLIGTFEFVVHKNMEIRWPWAETPTHYITMGFDEELDTATEIALREAIEFLVRRKGLARDDAYVLCAAAVDLNITQLVDGKKGVHAMIPKGIFR